MSVELARRVVAAANFAPDDAGPFERLLDPEVTVTTSRSTRVGAAEAIAWARKEFDHLRRGYAIDEYVEGPESVLAVGSVEYRWKDGGELAAADPIALKFGFASGLVVSIESFEDVTEARSAFPG